MKKILNRLILLLLFCNCGIRVKAQTPAIDSLLTVLPVAKENIGKLNILNAISIELLNSGNQGNYKSAFDHYKLYIIPDSFFSKP